MSLPLFRQIALAGALVAAPLIAAAQFLPYVKLKGERFVVELAQDDASRERGLMYREHMDTNRGMLFVFDQETPQAFWMKNTKIPLDMLFIDRNGKLVALHQSVPPCTADPCPVYPSKAPALYVLELNGGVTDKLGVKLGDHVEIHR
jgi:uncharacterized membrane protein (UPF0127 family)